MSNITATSIKPLGNRVVLKRSAAQTSRGGILLPETAKEKPLQGIVLAVGPGRIDEEGNLHRLSVKEGDIVLFSSYGGLEISLGDEEFMVVGEDDVLAVVQGQSGQ
jgi:chaperonin GroES